MRNLRLALPAFILLAIAARAFAETQVFVDQGKSVRLDAAAALGESKEAEGYLAIRSAKPGSAPDFATHYAGVAVRGDAMLAPGEFHVTAKLGIVRLDKLPNPLTLCVKVGKHYYDLLLEPGRVTVHAIRLDATRVEQIGLRHAVPMALDGTPFTLEFVRDASGFVRILLDGKLLLRLWIEPSGGDVALFIDRENLLRVVDRADVEAELRIFDWRATGSFAEPSDEQRAWDKLASRQIQLMKRVGNSYGYVEDDPKLPNVLLIGDSISIYYTDPVRRLLAGQADVFRTPMGPGRVETLFVSLDEFLKTRKWDVIHFNTGLHDFAIKNRKGTAEETLAAYGKNLETVIGKLQATGAKLIWASTTPVPPGSPGSSDELAVEYNQAAKELMDKHGIPINDLHALMLPKHEQYWLAPKNVHFNELGSAVMGRRVASVVLETLSPQAGK